MGLLRLVRNQWDRVGAWLVTAIGALALVLGWVGVSGTPYSFEQIPYVISGGLGGLFLLGVGAMLWISADLRDEWRELHELVSLEQVRVRHLEQASAHASDAPDLEVTRGPTPRGDDANGMGPADGEPAGGRRRRPIKASQP